MSPNRWLAAMSLAALLALSGCGRSDTDADPAGSAPPAPAAGEAPAPAPADSAFDITWQGVLPCADCDGIQTRLRLIADGEGRRYELQESYLAADGGELFEAQGAWTEQVRDFDSTSTVVYELDTNGAKRWFALQPDGALELLEAPDRASGNALAYRLQRM